eukprot:GHVS01037158.1.p1 GENE.GHVS01037158.1~~GHVS01037158.1.p1  ORF type:complete len:607 (+),score=120.63 GHVS01037158.1:37-1857(+)
MQSSLPSSSNCYSSSSPIATISASSLPGFFVPVYSSYSSRSCRRCCDLLSHGIEAVALFPHTDEIKPYHPKGGGGETCTEEEEEGWRWEAVCGDVRGNVWVIDMHDLQEGKHSSCYTVIRTAAHKEKSEEAVCCVALSRPSGNKLAVGFDNGSIECYKRSEGFEKSTYYFCLWILFLAHHQNAACWRLLFSNEELLLSCGRHDGFVKVWNLSLCSDMSQYMEPILAFQPYAESLGGSAPSNNTTSSTSIEATTKGVSFSCIIDMQAEVDSSGKVLLFVSLVNGMVQVWRISARLEHLAVLFLGEGAVAPTVRGMGNGRRVVVCGERRWKEKRKVWRESGEAEKKYRATTEWDKKGKSEIPQGNLMHATGCEVVVEDEHVGYSCLLWDFLTGQLICMKQPYESAQPSEHAMLVDKSTDPFVRANKAPAPLSSSLYSLTITNNHNVSVSPRPPAISSSVPLVPSLGSLPSTVPPQQRVNYSVDYGQRSRDDLCTLPFVCAPWRGRLVGVGGLRWGRATVGEGCPTGRALNVWNADNGECVSSTLCPMSGGGGDTLSAEVQFVSPAVGVMDGYMVTYGGDRNGAGVVCLWHYTTADVLLKGGALSTYQR